MQAPVQKAVLQQSLAAEPSGQHHDHDPVSAQPEQSISWLLVNIHKYNTSYLLVQLAHALGCQLHLHATAQHSVPGLGQESRSPCQRTLPLLQVEAPGLCQWLLPQ